MGEINILALKKLSASSRDGKTRKIRAIFADIEELIAAGVSYREIVDELNVQGVVVSVSHFGVILHQLRKQKKQKSGSTTISHLTESDATQKVNEPIGTESTNAKDPPTQATTKSIRAIFNKSVDLSELM